MERSAKDGHESSDRKAALCLGKGKCSMTVAREGGIILLARGTRKKKGGLKKAIPSRLCERGNSRIFQRRRCGLSLLGGGCHGGMRGEDNVRGALKQFGER